MLEKEHFEVKECLSPGSSKKSLCVIHYLSMENHSSSPSSDGNNSDDKGNWNVTAEESNWDAEYNQSVKINDEVIEDSEQNVEEKKGKPENDSNTSSKEHRVTLQFHSTLANSSQSIEPKEELKRDRSANKRQSSSFHSKLPSTSASHNNEKTPKKGTNIKNKDLHMSQGTSKDNESRKRKTDSNISNNVDNNEKRSHKKSIDLKVHDSTHSQGSNIPRSNRNAKTSSNSAKASPKGKVTTTSSLKRFPMKIEDSSLPSTSDIKKRKKGKKTDEDKDDIKALTECIIYNTLNNIPESDENPDEIRISETPKIKLPDIVNLSEIGVSSILSGIDVANSIGNEIIDQVLRTATQSTSSSDKHVSDGNDSKSKDLSLEPISQELNHASREALFDPNSETDMLEEFEIPLPPPPPPIYQIPATEHHNVILIGMTPTNEEETVGLY